jgi:hypothetical protein
MQRCYWAGHHTAALAVKVVCLAGPVTSLFIFVINNNSCISISEALYVPPVPRETVPASANLLLGGFTNTCRPQLSPALYSGSLPVRVYNIVFTNMNGGGAVLK